MRKALPLLAMLIFPLLSSAQEEEKPVSKETKIQRSFEDNYKQQDFDPETVTKPGRLKKLGFRAYNLGDYFTAIDFFEKYNAAKPDKWKVVYALAESARKARDYSKAYDSYARVAASKKSKKYPKSSFYQVTNGRQSGLVGNDEVATLMSKFTKEYKGKDAKIFKKLAKSEIASANNSKAIQDSNIKVLVNILPKTINTPSMESSPIIVDDKDLIYGSINADVEEFYSIRGEDRPDRKLYLASRTGPESWDSYGELPGPFNKTGYNVTSGAYSYDGLRFFFNRCPKDINGKEKCTIWMSKFKNGEWLEPRILPLTINMPGTNSTQPALGTVVDKKTSRKQDLLFFVSDRPKGKGGLDIWVAPYDNKTDGFKKAKSAGKINTAGDELTPYYNNENNTLYYSSNGSDQSLGGFDILYAEGKEKFLAGKNVGSPINTRADEVGFIMNGEGSEGYFVSNREGGFSTLNPTCCDDIYHFTYLEFIRLAVKGIVFEAANAKDKPNGKNELNGATLTLLTVDEENDTVPATDPIESLKDGSFAMRLNYGRNYLLKAEKEGFDERYVKLTTVGKTFSDTLIENIGIRKTPPKEVYIPIIYFETNRAALTKQQKAEIKEILLPVLKENPSMRLKIIGHSDDVGNDRFNVDLSQKRAKVVYKFLADEGAEKERFEIYGFGSTKPLYKPGYKGIDPEFARGRNRRVQFEVVDPVKFKLIEKGVDQVLEKGEKFEE